jgi:hypothetical protein
MHTVQYSLKVDEMDSVGQVGEFEDCFDDDFCGDDGVTPTFVEDEDYDLEDDWDEDEHDGQPSEYDEWMSYDPDC